MVFAVFMFVMLSSWLGVVIELENQAMLRNQTDGVQVTRTGSKYDQAIHDHMPLSLIGQHGAFDSEAGINADCSRMLGQLSKDSSLSAVNHTRIGSISAAFNRHVTEKSYQ